jgi:hypothetical protein
MTLLGSIKDAAPRRGRASIGSSVWSRDEEGRDHLGAPLPHAAQGLKHSHAGGTALSALCVAVGAHGCSHHCGETAALSRPVGRGCLAPSFLQFTLRRQVPLSDAAVVRLQKWGVGVFGQLEEIFRGFQLAPNPARWINHCCTPGVFSAFSAPCRGQKVAAIHAPPFLAWVWPAGHCDRGGAYLSACTLVATPERRKTGAEAKKSPSVAGAFGARIGGGWGVRVSRSSVN